MGELTRDDYVKAAKDCRAPRMRKNKDDKEVPAEIKFDQSVELQVCFKNIDRVKETGFKTSALLDHPFHDKNFSIGFLASQKDIAKGTDLGLHIIKKEELDTIKTDKKACKRLAKKYDYFLASVAMIKTIPKPLRQALAVRGKFPQAIIKTEEISNKVEEAKRKVNIVLKIKPKAPLNIGFAIGKASMSDEDIATNATTVMTEVLNKCKKKWSNIQGVVMKSSMGSPVRVM
eukprot:GAHX01000596.1.p1 GENE.GAHX01000596.1~~GAHX01000596.1.p1  ORF type:complete len:231 (+),score=60.20 GAHX01000596.1:36-728(+)